MADSNDDDDASLPRSAVQILKTTGSFASSASEDDADAGDYGGGDGGGGSSRSVSSFAAAASGDDGELQREIANVSTEDIYEILLPDDDDSELPKTPSRTLVVGTIPDSSESGGGGSGGSSSSDSDSAIAELRSIATDSRTGAVAAASVGGSASADGASLVTPPGDGESSVVSYNSASIAGSYSIMRGVIPSPSVASSRGTSPTKSLKSVARSLKSIGSKSSRGSGSKRAKGSAVGSDFSDKDGGKGGAAAARKSSSASSPVRKLLTKSAALGAAAAGGVAAALTGKGASTASTPARSALSLGSGDIVHSGETPAPSPERFMVGEDVGVEEKEEEEVDVEGGSSTPNSSSGEVEDIDEVAVAGEATPGKDNGAPADGDNQIKMFALGCACLSLVMVVLLAVGLSLGFTRSAENGPPTPPTMPPVTRRPTRAPTPRTPTIATPVAVPTSSPILAPSATITAEPSMEKTPPLIPTASPTAVASGSTSVPSSAGSVIDSSESPTTPSTTVAPTAPTITPTSDTSQPTITPTPITATPTGAPTTSNPTIGTTSLAPTSLSTTRIPTVAPATGVPTVSPETAEPTAFEAERYIKDIAPDPDALETPGTPQNLAYEWVLSQENVDSLTPTEVEQQYSLATLFYSTGGENVEELEGWLDPSIPECEWFGVECIDSTAQDESAPQSRQAVSSSGDVVVKLDLSEVGLAGEIPRDILLLKDLKNLLLYRNDLSGSIPAEIYNLTKLERLELDLNAFSGSISSYIGNLQSLSILRLDHNMLTGSLPEELGRITSLQKIRLDTNRFSGNVPSKWGFLSSAETIMLHRNYIVGEVPLSLCLLTFDRLNTLSSDCSDGGSVSCICCTLCSTGYPESTYNPYTSWQGYPPEDSQQQMDSEDGGVEQLETNKEPEAELANVMNKVAPRFPARTSTNVERHEIRRDVFVPCSWITRKSSKKAERCQKITIEGALMSDLCPSQCS